jgi:hypothetical protein
MEELLRINTELYLNMFYYKHQANIGRIFVTISL